MKLKPFHIYSIGFIITVTVGFIYEQYMGFVLGGALYAILMGFIIRFFKINPVEKSIYDRRKKEL